MRRLKPDPRGADRDPAPARPRAREQTARPGPALRNLSLVAARHARKLDAVCHTPLRWTPSEPPDGNPETDAGTWRSAADQSSPGGRVALQRDRAVSVTTVFLP